MNISTPDGVQSEHEWYPCGGGHPVGDLGEARVEALC